MDESPSSMPTSDGGYSVISKTGMTKLREDWEVSTAKNTGARGTGHILLKCCGH